MDDLFELLSRQGFVTTRDAARLGSTPGALHAHAAAGRLRHALYGVYLPPGRQRPESELAALTRGVLAQDSFAVASHQSVLALHDLPCHRLPSTPIHVADARKSSRIHASVHRHVLRPGDKVAEVDGWRSLCPALGCLQVAARYGVGPGLVAMDAALRRGLTAPEELRALADSGRVRRGLVRARTAVDLADGRAESPGESLLRLALSLTPWRLEPQVWLGDGTASYRVDLLIDGVLVVEFDGDTKYGGADGPTALIAEKRREDWLRAQGFGVERVTWSQLGYPAALRQSLHRALVRARTTHVLSRLPDAAASGRAS